MRAILLYAVVVVAVCSLGEARRHRTGHRRQHIKRQRVRRLLFFHEDEWRMQNLLVHIPGHGFFRRKNSFH